MLQEYTENEYTQPTLDMNDDGEPDNSVQNGNSIAIQTDPYHMLQLMKK